MYSQLKPGLMFEQNQPAIGRNRYLARGHIYTFIKQQGCLLLKGAYAGRDLSTKDESRFKLLGPFNQISRPATRITFDAPGRWWIMSWYSPSRPSHVAMRPLFTLSLLKVSGYIGQIMMSARKRSEKSIVARCRSSVRKSRRKPWFVSPE